MRFLLITEDAAMAREAREGLHPSDELTVHDDWREALDAAKGADLIFVDMVATFEAPHKTAGYEAFAEAKMGHPEASKIPLVVISPEPDYDLDFVVGFPDFALANVRRPVTYKVFRRASTWV